VGWCYRHLFNVATFLRCGGRREHSPLAAAASRFACRLFARCCCGTAPSARKLCLLYFLYFVASASERYRRCRGSAISYMPGCGGSLAYAYAMAPRTTPAVRLPAAWRWALTGILLFFAAPAIFVSLSCAVAVLGGGREEYLLALSPGGVLLRDYRCSFPLPVDEQKLLSVRG